MTQVPARKTLSRPALAYLMIVVAALGATVAYWIARAEHETARRHRQLTRGHMLELSLRQVAVGDTAMRETLEARQRAHNARAKGLQESAAGIRTDDPRQAGLLEMQAQQELRLSRLIATLITPFDALPAGDNVEQRIARRVESELEGLGFWTPGAPRIAQASAPAKTPDPPATDKGAATTPNAAAAPAAAPTPPSSPSATPSPTPTPVVTYEKAVDDKLLGIWQRLSDTIGQLHHRVPLLAQTVVLFVAALVFFTIADLLPKLARAAIAAGSLAALGALVAAILWDPSIWLALSGVGAACVLLGLVLRRLGLFAEKVGAGTTHLLELEPEQYPGSHVILHHAHTWRERAVVMVIAITVLLSATVGYWLADSQTHATEATHRAFATEVTMNNVSGERWLLSGAGAISGTLELFQARMRCAFESQAVLLPFLDQSLPALPVLTQDRDRDCRDLNTERNLRSANFVDGTGDFDSGDRPADKVFAELRNRGDANPSYLYALADGYISEAEHWESKAASFILGLTLFAIAIYLLSQALAMGESKASLVLASCGILLAIGTFISSARLRAAAIPAAAPASKTCTLQGAPVETAATYYGLARTAYESASTSGEYTTAADLFACAVAARPDFARARWDQSRADGLISQGDVDGRYSNFPTRARMGQISASYRDMLATLERAGWTPTPRLLNSLGFNTFLAAVAAPNAALLDDAAAALERGITIGGLGTPEGTIDAVKVKTAARSSIDAHQMLYTNLGLVRLARGEREAAERAYVAALDGLDLAQNQALVASSLSDLNILEGHCKSLHSQDDTRCQEIQNGIDATRKLLLIGRSNAPAGSGRAAIAGIQTWVRASRVGWSAQMSGFDPARDRLSVVWSAFSDDWNVWRVVQPLFKPVDTAALETGRTARITPYANAPSHCLPRGKYRAEFYINGVRIAGGGSPGVDAPAYRNVRSRELDIAFCAPSDWKPTTFRQNQDGRHLYRSFTNGTGNGAVYLFTFFTPRVPLDATTRVPAERAWSLMKRVLSAPPTDEWFRAASARFTTCQDPIPPTTVLHRSWTSADGLVRVAFVIGDAAPNGHACQVLESIGGYYDRDDAQLKGR